MELESEKQLDWYCGFWGESGVSGHVFFVVCTTDRSDSECKTSWGNTKDVMIFLGLSMVIPDELENTPNPTNYILR